MQIFNLLIQVQIALLCLETHQRVREGLHGVPDLHHWDLAGSDEGVRVQEVAGFGGCPGIMVQPEKVRAAIQRFSLVWELEHCCLLTEMRRVLVVSGTVLSGSSLILGPPEADDGAQAIFGSAIWCLGDLILTILGSYSTSRNSPLSRRSRYTMHDCYSTPHSHSRQRPRPQLSRSVEDAGHDICQRLATARSASRWDLGSPGR
jgi:hypothetical protein